MAEVIVVDLDRPWNRLLAWALREEGVSVEETAGIPDAVAAVGPDTRCVVLNTVDEHEALTPAIEELRAAEKRPLIVSLHGPRRHASTGGVEAAADVCVHAPADCDDLTCEIHRILQNAGAPVRLTRRRHTRRRHPRARAG